MQTYWIAYLIFSTCVFTLPVIYGTVKWISSKCFVYKVIDMEMPKPVNIEMKEKREQVMTLKCNKKLINLLLHTIII